MKCDAEPKASYSNLVSWSVFVCFSAASREEDKDSSREEGEGKEEAVFRERGVCRQSTRLYHPCQDDSAYTCFFSFWLFHPKFLSYSPPLRNKTTATWSITAATLWRKDTQVKQLNYSDLQQMNCVTAPCYIYWRLNDLLLQRLYLEFGGKLWF